MKNAINTPQERPQEAELLDKIIAYYEEIKKRIRELTEEMEIVNKAAEGCLAMFESLQALEKLNEAKEAGRV